MTTTQDHNKALIQRYLDEVWGKGNIAAADQFLAPDYKRYLSPVAEPLHLDGQKQRLAGFRAAFPDIHITMEDMVAEGDYVVFRSTMRATHQGVFQGLPPTGRRVTVTLLDVIRIENGMFIEHWGGPDLFDLVKQMGANISVEKGS
jgi:predicted ester cyclase